MIKPSGIVALILLVQCISSLHSYPDYLPYANEAFGGSSQTYRNLSDSNVDWGQHLKEVAAYKSAHNISECWVAYSNMSIDPADLPCKALPTGLALIAGIPQPVVPPHIHGTVLISTVDADGALWGPDDLNPYRQFREGHPDGMIGNSVLVYHGDFDVPLASAQSHMSQFMILLRMHQMDAALDEANAALAIDPQSPILEADMGDLMLRLGRPDEANRRSQRQPNWSALGAQRANRRLLPRGSKRLFTRNSTSASPTPHSCPHPIWGRSSEAPALTDYRKLVIAAVVFHLHVSS